ncbi:Fur family transcriptional regulator [Propionicicella superfundia]|uniref:Fur family transcriptional regulator n=1 Tax=Propionicicella superfundia TaxID=348582 RepID=UPI0004202B23|nr:Fur family transcriptional regulator [Propionicicella superfundia]
MTEHPTLPQPLRRTRQRAALATLLAGSSEFKTAQDLHGELMAAGEQVGIATVYRTLQLMADAGELDAIRTADGHAAYRSCSTRHHHHLICRDCGKTVEIQAPDFETWAGEIARANGFTDIAHELELFGRCADHGGSVSA